MSIVETMVVWLEIAGLFGLTLLFSSAIAFLCISAIVRFTTGSPYNGADAQSPSAAVSRRTLAAHWRHMQS
jgi:hypothetical protein